VLAVSSGDAEFNKHLVDDRRLPFHILSDAGCEVMKQYDIYNEYDILTGPFLFIINSAGLINFMYDGKSPDDIVEVADLISMLHQLNEESEALIFGGVAERNL
jgi:peroxiredoxin